MKKFQVFKSDGKPEIIEADRVEFTKKKDGLFLKFFIGQKVTLKFDKVIGLLEILPEVSPAIRNQVDDDED